ncbi:MAG TPA: hypothetical protein VGG36_00870 [Rhizomicrobium sp.]|jgi:hypothetical protein
MRNQLLTLAAAVLIPGLAFASPVAPATATVTLTGSIGNACHMGDLSSSQISVGTLTNSSDGTLAAISGSPNTTITGSWCNVGSKITISALPMVAQGYSGSPPSGFTKAVNYTATESGWGAPTPSDTSQGTTSGADSGSHSGSADVGTAEANTITVTLSNFTAPVSGSRLVADNNYQGTITVTLTAAS